MELEVQMRKRGFFMEWLDDIWRIVGARHAVQEQEQIGMGFVAWRWKGSVFSVECV